MIHYSYDSVNDLLYLSLADRPVVQTLEVSTTCFVDVDEVGRAVGIEVLDASHGWPIEEVIDRFDLRELRWELASFGDLKPVVSSPAGAIHVSRQPAMS